MPYAAASNRKDTRDWWFVPAGGLTLLAVVGTFLALDDITTDRATSFRAEYLALAFAGLWILALAVALFRIGRRKTAALCVAVLVPAWWLPLATLGGAVLIALFLILRGWKTFMGT